MLVIKIEEFTGYDYTKFYTYLLKQGESVFQIQIPKFDAEENGDSFSNYWSYLMAAYCGQLLYNISDHFGYYVPCRKGYTSYRFEIVLTDMETLAEYLVTITNFFIDWRDPDSGTAFQEGACKFFEDSYDENIEQATVGLIVIADDFLEKFESSRGDKTL